MTPNAKFLEQAKVVVCLLGTVPSSSTPQRVSLKDYRRVLFLILVKNATTVTGSAITLKQSTTVAGGSEKALSFTKAHRTLDIATNGDTLSEFTVASDTFTTDNTDSKNHLYAIEVTPDMLDVDGGFDVVRVGTGNATAATVTVLAVLGPAGHQGDPTTLTSAIAN